MFCLYLLHACRDTSSASQHLTYFILLDLTIAYYTGFGSSLNLHQSTVMLNTQNKRVTKGIRPVVVEEDNWARREYSKNEWVIGAGALVGSQT